LLARPAAFYKDGAIEIDKCAKALQALCAEFACKEPPAIQEANDLCDRLRTDYIHHVFVSILDETVDATASDRRKNVFKCEKLAKSVHVDWTTMPAFIKAKANTAKMLD
jgi:hypothetical protein